MFRQIFVTTQGTMCGKMAKCDMGEMHSEKSFLRVTYFLNDPKGLFKEMIYGMPI